MYGTAQFQNAWRLKKKQRKENLLLESQCIHPKRHLPCRYSEDRTRKRVDKSNSRKQPSGSPAPFADPNPGFPPFSNNHQNTKDDIALFPPTPHSANVECGISCNFPHAQTSMAPLERLTKWINKTGEYKKRRAARETVSTPQQKDSLHTTYNPNSFSSSIKSWVDTLFGES